MQRWKVRTPIFRRRGMISSQCAAMADVPPAGRKREPVSGPVIGSDMKALIVPFVLAFLVGCREIATETGEYRPTEAGTVDHALCLLGFTGIPLTELLTGHHLVEATVNGRPGHFVLDTGANLSVLDAAHVQDFGLSGDTAAPGAAIGLGGTMKARQLSVDSLAIGPVAIRQRSMAVADLSQLTDVLRPFAGGTPIHGIIGHDVMEEHRAVIDVAGPVLYLIEPDEAPAPVPVGRCLADEESPPPSNR